MTSSSAPLYQCWPKKVNLITIFLPFKKKKKNFFEVAKFNSCILSGSSFTSHFIYGYFCAELNYRLT